MSQWSPPLRPGLVTFLGAVCLVIGLFMLFQFIAYEETNQAQQEQVEMVDAQQEQNVPLAALQSERAKRSAESAAGSAAVLGGYPAGDRVRPRNEEEPHPPRRATGYLGQNVRPAEGRDDRGPDL